MRTLIIYNDIEDMRFLIVDGDYSRFNGIIINSIKDTGYEDEFCEFLFDPEGGFRYILSDDISLIENKEWDKVALTTFLP